MNLNKNLRIFMKLYHYVNDKNCLDYKQTEVYNEEEKLVKRDLLRIYRLVYICLQIDLITSFANGLSYENKQNLTLKQLIKGIKRC